jgi:hypothetical protein
MDIEGFIKFTIFLIIVIGPIAVIKIYWQALTEFVTAIWQVVIQNPELQNLLAQMFADKAKEYIIGNIAYIVVGILFNILPFRINGSKAFWIVYGLLLFVVNGIIAAI